MGVSKTTQDTTSRRRIKRQEKITCAKFSTDSDEFSKIELTGTAEEINQKIAKYSGLAEAVIENLIKEIKAKEDEITNNGGTLPPTKEAQETSPASGDKSTTPGSSSPGGSSPGGSSPGGSTPGGSSPEGSSPGGSSPGGSSPGGSSPGGESSPSSGGSSPTGGSTSTGEST